MTRKPLSKLLVKIGCSILLLICLALTGCASKSNSQAQIRRAYAAGEQAARAQMEQAQLQSSRAQIPVPQDGDPQVRILGSVKNPVLIWTEGLTLGRALVEAEYKRTTTPAAITIYRNNFPLPIDPQRLLQGEDYPLYPGDIVHIQD
jgi:hypothetical protein